MAADSKQRESPRTRVLVRCTRCGAEVSRRPSDLAKRVFCSSECWHQWMKLNRHKEKNPNWRGVAAGVDGKRRRAHRWYDASQCSRCGSGYAERHHIDGDIGNNAPENIAILCRRCHMEADGRLLALIERNRGSR